MTASNLAWNSMGLGQLVPCVICYVPGSGANKLVQTLSQDHQLQATTHGSPQLTAYLARQAKQHSPLTTTVEPSQIPAPVTVSDTGPSYDLWPQLGNYRDLEPWPSGNDVAVTHCMSSEIVRHQFPGRRIIKIFGPVMLALRRWWVVYGRDRQYPNPRVSDGWQGLLSAVGTDARRSHIAHQILFHLEYYQHHWDTGCDYFIDIREESSSFGDFMSRDYQSCWDPDFDYVQDLLEQNPKIQKVLAELRSPTSGDMNP